MREQSLAAAVGSYAYDAYKQYSGEKQAQPLSTAQKVGYGVARGVLGATESGAAGVATGKVSVADEFVTYWDLNPTQRSVIDGGLSTIKEYTTYLSILFPPAAVIPCAIGIVTSALKFGEGDIAGGATDLLGSVLVGLLATGKVAEWIGNMVGARVAGLIGKNPRAFLSKVINGQAGSLEPEIRVALGRLAGESESVIQTYYASTSYSLRGVAILLKTLLTQAFDIIDGKIAELLVKLGGPPLSASYKSLRQNVLKLLDNPVGNSTITAAMSKADQVAGASA